MKKTEEQFSNEARKAFDASVDGIDAATLSKLNRSRQRALGERGLTAGRFFTIYNEEAAAPIDDEALRKRYQSKRDTDLSEIHERMEQVEIERAYRIVGSLEKTARAFEEKTVPALQQILDRWRRRTLIGDAIAAIAIVAGVIVAAASGWLHISAAAIGGSCIDTPGLTTMRSARSKADSSKPPRKRASTPSATTPTCPASPPRRT